MAEASTPIRRLIGCEVLAEGGLFHATSIPALRRILRDDHLRPALETGTPARGAGVASLCRRLGGVCLFDVLPKAEAARSRLPNPIGEYVAGHTLTNTDLRDALARLHHAWLAQAQAEHNVSP